MKKMYCYKNIEVIGFYTYKAIYKTEDGKTFTLYTSDGKQTKKEVLKIAKEIVNNMNK